MAAPTAEDAITTLIFDIDDTLYDVGSGFTAHRNGAAVCDFMQAKLKFETAAAAKAIRDEYFEKYHATVKGLTVAEADGRLPAGAHFEAADLAEWCPTRLAVKCSGTPVRSHWVMNHLRVEWNTVPCNSGWRRRR